MKLAAIQMNSGQIVSENLAAARKYIGEAVRDGADIVVLPENFSLISGRHSERLSAAQSENDIRNYMANIARQYQVILVGGSVPILAGDNRVTNTCLVYDRDGSNIGRYDKIHLFDVELEQGETYSESRYISPGEKPVTVNVLSTCIGLSICYDIRFPELYRELTLQGAQILTVPSAFTIPTGEAHWKPLLRARAIENLCWLVAAAQVGDHPGRSTWGHSVIINPWGEVVAEKAAGVGHITAEVDLQKLRDLRASFPCLNHRRL